MKHLYGQHNDGIRNAERFAIASLILKIIEKKESVKIETISVIINLWKVSDKAPVWRSVPSVPMEADLPGLSRLFALHTKTLGPIFWHCHCGY